MSKLTFLGTGTSQGVPLIACPCEVCHSTDERDKRLRSSVAIEHQGISIVIDTGPDFRQQMLRAEIDSIDAVLYTHGHKDHVAGLDDIRAYNFILGKPIDLYLDQHTEEGIRQEYSYIFADKKYPGIPQVELHRATALQPIDLEGLSILPIPVMHAQLPVLGYRIGDLSYITDANFISEEAMEALSGSKILVLNALRHEKHISHFSLTEALEIAKQVGATQTYFTHISHQLGKHSDVADTLPDGVQLAYDTLEVSF